MLLFLGYLSEKWQPWPNSIGIWLGSITLKYVLAKKRSSMKYYLILIISLSVAVHAQKNKRKVNPIKDYYKRALYQALLECKDLCKRTTKSEYISQSGVLVMQKMARNLAAQQEYTAAIFQIDHANFLEFIAEVKRKVNPSIYAGLLEESFDGVNEAFNDMEKRKTKDKRRRLAQKKPWEDSNSVSAASIEDVLEYYNE